MKTETRHSQVDVEKCVQNSGNNKFDLILAATARVRELRQQRHETAPVATITDVLLEIQTGTIDPAEYKRKVK